MSAKQIPQDTLRDFERALGKEYVVADTETLARYEKSTFATTQAIPLVLRPGSVEDVQAIMRIANQYKTPIYPISTGLNTGYGSAVPSQSGSIVMELKRLDEILEYNHELGYVKVQPGVTQKMLFSFLQEKGGKFWIDCTGSYPDHSMIGNIAERGFGHTRYADHFANVAGFQVVLPQGEVLRTGFGRFANAKSADVYRWGVGPHFDGLFTQSNLGVITEATIWLMPKPECTQFFVCSVESDQDLGGLIEALKPLRMDGTIQSAMHIGNDYKVITASQAYPYELMGDKTPLSREVLDRLMHESEGGAWNATGALYGDKKQIRAARSRLKSALRGVASRVQFIDERLLNFAERVAAPYRFLTRKNLAQALKVIRPVFGMTQGQPSDTMLPSNYWRKRALPDPSPDLSPELDNCGVLWIAPVAPTSGEHATRVWQIVREIMLQHGFEPAVSITFISERALDCVVNISYDRDVDGEDAKAMACYDELLAKLCAQGYYPYRLGIQAQGKLPDSNSSYLDFVQRIRSSMDPNSILAPGRYIE